MMKRYQTDFSSTMKQCLTDLYTFTQIESVKKLLDIYDRLDVSKIMFKYLETMENNDRELKNKDEILFSQPIVFFPGIDMSIVWLSLTVEQKNTTWTYLNLLYSTGRVIVSENSQIDDLSMPSSLSDIDSFSYDKHTTKTKQKGNNNLDDDIKKKQQNDFEKVNQTENLSSSSLYKNISKLDNVVQNKNNVVDIIEKLNKLDNLDLGSKHSKNKDKKNKKKNINNIDDEYMGFDPYVGVGNGMEFGVNDIIDNANCAHEDENSSGKLSFEAIGKLLNVDDVVKQIENIAPNDIDETSDKIKSVLKTQFDEKSETGTIINDIIEDVTHEFKNGFTNIDENGNTISSMDKIMNISTKIAEKIIPKITSSNIQLEDMLKSAMDLHHKCGEGMNNNELNGHMDMLTNLFKQMCPTDEKKSKQKNKLCYDSQFNNNTSNSKHGKHKSHKDL